MPFSGIDYRADAESKGIIFINGMGIKSTDFFVCCYYSQPLHTHAQKQPAKPSADAAHLDFLLMWVK